MKIALGLLVALACGLAHASDGAGYVPAHRTKDGHFVPANVPPSSAGTAVSKRSAKSRAGAAQRGQSARLLPPLLVEAQSVRK